MARITGTAGFGEYSDYEAVHFDIDAAEAAPEYLAGETAEVAVVLDDGTQARDPETGAVLTERKVVRVGRMETLEEAVTKYLAANITLDEVTRTGISSLSFEVRFTVSGSTIVELEDYELEEYEVDADDVDEDWIRDTFEEAIDEAIADEVRGGGWNTETEYEIDVQSVE